MHRPVDGTGSSPYRTFEDLSTSVLLLGCVSCKLSQRIVLLSMFAPKAIATEKSLPLPINIRKANSMTFVTPTLHLLEAISGTRVYLVYIPEYKLTYCQVLHNRIDPANASSIQVDIYFNALVQPEEPPAGRAGLWSRVLHIVSTIRRSPLSSKYPKNC